MRINPFCCSILAQWQSDAPPHACFTYILICCVILLCTVCCCGPLRSWAVLPRATPCKSMRRGEMKYRKMKQNQCKVSWLWFKGSSGCFPNGLSGYLLICADGGWKEFHRMFKRKSPDIHHYLPFIFTTAKEGVQCGRLHKKWAGKVYVHDLERERVLRLKGEGGRERALRRSSIPQQAAKDCDCCAEQEEEEEEHSQRNAQQQRQC